MPTPLAAALTLAALALWAALSYALALTLDAGQDTHTPEQHAHWTRHTRPHTRHTHTPATNPHPRPAATI